VKVNGYPSINSEKVGTNVTFIYPLAPFQTISVKSQRAVGDVAGDVPNSVENAKAGVAG
jgi:hypothetical protein